MIFWDVTDQKQAEAALDYERYLLHALLDNVPDSIYFKDRESRFVRVSQSLGAKFGLDNPSEAIGKSDADYFTAEHAAPALADEQEIVRTGQPMLTKVEQETWDDGSQTWCSTTKMPLRDKRGEIIGTFGISRDITELKQAEDALEHERDLLRTLTDHLPDLIFVKDREGRFITANLALLRLMGLSSLKDLVGKTDADFISEELAAQYRVDDQHVIQTGKALIDREESAVDEVGNDMWLLTTKVPLRNRDGQVIGLVGDRPKHHQAQTD